MKMTIAELQKTDKLTETVIKSVSGIRDFSKFEKACRTIEDKYNIIKDDLWQSYFDTALSPEVVLSEYLGLPYKLIESYERLETEHSFRFLKKEKKFYEDVEEYIVYTEYNTEVISFISSHISALIKICLLDKKI